jgi:DMSO/TMAO reductase YedYZ molybdopterin-dependent catalytic subunit
MVKKQMSFQGVWLADVLKVAGVDQSARSVHFTALDDFQTDLTTTQIAKGGIFLATKSGDGSPIDIENGGPTRIVFMDGVKAGKNEDAWIWSLKTLDVK